MAAEVGGNQQKKWGCDQVNSPIPEDPLARRLSQLIVRSEAYAVLVPSSRAVGAVQPRTDARSPLSWWSEGAHSSLTGVMGVRATGVRFR
jgi:hypothetical protein